MADIRFIVSDLDPTSADYGQLAALDSANATGIPIPAFRYGPARPITGTTAGEGFLNTTSHEAAIWTGSKWEPIAPPAINLYNTDSDVLADTNAQVGTYGTSKATGNLYIRTNTGWRMVGVRSYPTLAGLWADQPADGSIGVDMAGNSIWLRVNGAWMPQSPVSYTTEAALLAATPRDSQIGIAEDTGLVYVGINGVWRRVNSPTMTVAPTQPATPAMGDLWFDDVSGTGMVWTGAQWKSMNAEPIGEVKWYAGRVAPPNFLLCNGAAIPALYADLITLIGPNTPNLMQNGGSFPRAGTPETGFPQHQDTTRLPRTPFTTSNPGDHTHNITVHGHNWDQTVNGTNVGGGYNVQGNRATGGAGGHTHTLAGGDSETAPRHTLLLPIIRAA